MDDSRSSCYAPRSGWLSWASFCILLLVASDGVLARSGGINGYSGNPATNGGAICNACHSGGQIPTVTLDGPTLVAPDTVSTYTLTITGGQETAGGLDVSATAGTLVIADPGTRLSSGEVTHNSPRTVDGNGAVVFSFNWQAPSTPGTATIYGAGNSVNLAMGNGGDFPSSDVLFVTVEGATASPGETSGDGLAPLLITQYVISNGDMSISFEAGCEATNTNIYFGPLSSVSSYGLDSETCGIGTSGSYSFFNPGPGDYFFMVVGNKGVDEGSYGRNRLPAENERPSFPANACGVQQVLADRCD